MSIRYSLGLFIEELFISWDSSIIKSNVTASHSECYGLYRRHWMVVWHLLGMCLLGEVKAVDTAIPDTLAMRSSANPLTCNLKLYSHTQTLLCQPSWMLLQFIFLCMHDSGSFRGILSKQSFLPQTWKQEGKCLLVMTKYKFQVKCLGVCNTMFLSLFLQEIA